MNQDNNQNRFQNFNPDELRFKGSDEISMLKNIIEKIEKLEEQKSDISEEIKDVYANAKNEGFDAKILKKILAMRRVKPEKLEEEEMLIEHYKKLLGMK
jgi:uncharacterized protein (UPF0335 family)